MNPTSTVPPRSARGSELPARAVEPAALAVGALAVSFALTLSFALAPPAPPSEAAMLTAYASTHAQEVEVEEDATAEHLVATGAVTRDEYRATAGIETLKASGTNQDWAKLVLLFAGFPMTDTNVTVINRWMRRTTWTNWWNRNNTFNNGWGASAGAEGAPAAT